MKDDAIVTQGLTKRFGSFSAVTEVNLRVRKGDVYALVGPNGAGKTTLVKMLVGLLAPTGGYASLFGHNVMTQPVSAKELFGYVSDDPTAYEYLSGREFLTLTGRLRGMTERVLTERIGKLTSLFPIEDILSRPMSEYSRGNRQKTAFLASIMTTPPVLIIDEPIVGLDPASIAILGGKLVAYAHAGGTVFFVTHIMDFAERFARTVGIMKAGKIVREVEVTQTLRLEELVR